MELGDEGSAQANCLDKRVGHRPGDQRLVRVDHQLDKSGIFGKSNLQQVLFLLETAVSQQPTSNVQASKTTSNFRLAIKT